MVRQLTRRRFRRALGCSAAVVALLGAAPALAQAGGGENAAAMVVLRLVADHTVPPEKGAELLNQAGALGAVAGGPAAAAIVLRLVADGTVSPEKGAGLLDQAGLLESAGTPFVARNAAPSPAATGAPAAPSEAIPTAPGATGALAASALPPPANGSMRVQYVPQPVRDQIKDELRTEVMAQAKREGWAAPDLAAPSWVKNFSIHGDMRFRSFSTFYSEDNSPLIIDASRWNATGPHDLEDPAVLLPVLNATNNRLNQAQLRARLFMKADVGDRFQVGLQLATGDNNGPISTNDFMGGGFRKRDIWLQNAYLKGDLFPGVTAMIGRFDNPLRTTDLMFDPDLAFDGVYGEVDVAKLFGYPSYTLAIRGGAFPIDFGDPDFPSTDINKRNFRDRYLYSVQGELGKKFENGVDVRFDAGFHNFTYLRGHVSDPCDVYSAPGIECSTDALAPMFMSKGNTWAYLRQFDLTNQTGALVAPELIGYKFAFRVLDLSASVSAPIGDTGVTARLTGNYLHNFGFDPENICREGIAGQPQNNVSDDSIGVCEPGSTAKFRGGNKAWGVNLALGKPHLFRANAFAAKRGDWAVVGGYKYIESDAVPDFITDSDFHLGGTNAKGYYLQATYAPFNNVTLSARWLSANEITYQPLSIDVLHFDLGVAF